MATVGGDAAVTGFNCDEAGTKQWTGRAAPDVSLELKFPDPRKQYVAELR